MKEFDFGVIANCILIDVNDLHRFELIFYVKYMVNNLLSNDFKFDYLLLFNIDVNCINSLSDIKLKFLFNYCKLQYVDSLLFYLDNKNKDSN